MKFFIDSANLDDLRKATAYGVVDGVTTNPSLIAKEGHDHRDRIDQRQLLADLVALQYRRSDANFIRGTFRVRGDTVEIYPAHLDDRPGLV